MGNGGADGGPAVSNATSVTSCRLAMARSKWKVRAAPPPNGGKGISGTITSIRTLRPLFDPAAEVENDQPVVLHHAAVQRTDVAGEVGVIVQQPKGRPCEDKKP